MAKQPYFPHYTGDWLSDPRVSMLTAAARGIWIDVLSALHRSDSCTLTGTPDQLARVLRCLESELQSALSLFQITRLADLEQRTTNGLKIITLVAADLRADFDERDRNALKQKNYRNRQRGNGVTLRDDSVTDDKPCTDSEINETLPERNPKVLRSSYTDSNTNTNGGGGGCNTQHAGAHEENPPPPENLNAKTEARLDELQGRFPTTDVRFVRKKYLEWCNRNGKKANWQVFEDWLKSEFEPMPSENGNAAPQPATMAAAEEFLQQKYGLR